jgi:hypothetical protein
MSDIRQTQSDEPLSGQTLPVLYNVVYCSRATPEVDEAAIARIIATARRDNPRKGITGLLVFGKGIFFQWLEGPRDNVTGLMNALMRDTRHDTIVRLAETEEIRERLFPEWDMELVTASEIRDVLEDALEEAADPRNAAALRRLLAELDAGSLHDLSPD